MGTAERSDVWHFVAPGADIDEAYDVAVAAAADGAGASHPLLDVTPDQMDLAYHEELVAGGSSGTRTAAGALGAALTAADVSDTVVAIPYSADRFWARRRINIKIDDADLEIGADGLVTSPIELSPSEELLRALLAIDDVALADGELVDTTTLLRLRCRYRTVVTKGEGKQVRQFVARTSAGTLVGTGRTAGEARREAMVAMKGPLDDAERYHVEVYSEVRRESGPHLALERVRIAQRGAVRIAVAAEKDSTRTKIAGWVFAGRAALETSSHEEAHGESDEPTPDGGLDDATDLDVTLSADAD